MKDEFTPPSRWAVAVPAHPGWVARYDRIRDADGATWPVTLPLVGWAPDGTALVLDKDQSLVPAKDRVLGVPERYDRVVFKGIEVEEREFGVVPGQGWTLRDDANGIDYPVIAFQCERHETKPVCVVSTNPARLYTPAAWREMKLVPPND